MFQKLRQRINDRNILWIYAVAFVLSLAYGLALALTPIFLETRGYNAASIGSLASFFGFGLVASAVPQGKLLERFSPKWILVSSNLIYALAIAAFPWMPNYYSMAACRFVDGAASVGVWISFETYLLLRSKTENKALVTSLYAMASGLGYVIGPLLARAMQGYLSEIQGFSVAASLALASTLLAFLVLDAVKTPTVHVPTPSEVAHVEASRFERKNTLQLLGSIRVSAFATFLTGYFQSASVLFLPLYLMHEKNIERSQTPLVIAFSAAGMLTFSNIAGRLGDRFGHLFMMRNLAAVGVLGLLTFTVTSYFPFALIAVFFGGGCLMSLPPLSLALQGVIIHPEDVARSNGLFNVCFACGLLLGPWLTGQIFEHQGGTSVVYHFAVWWTLFIAFSWFARKDDPRLQKSRQLASNDESVLESA